MQSGWQGPDRVALGRKLSMTAYYCSEFANHLAAASAAWAAFFKLKEVFCNRKVLFVTDAGYVSAAKCLALSTLAVPGPWVNYVQRATHCSEDLASTHGATDWVNLKGSQKWSLAAKLLPARMTDGRNVCSP